MNKISESISARDAILVAGFLCLVGGIAMVCTPAALAVGGTLLMLGAWRMAEPARKLEVNHCAPDARAWSALRQIATFVAQIEAEARPAAAGEKK